MASECIRRKALQGSGSLLIDQTILAQGVLGDGNQSHLPGATGAWSPGQDTGDGNGSWGGVWRESSRQAVSRDMGIDGRKK